MMQSSVALCTYNGAQYIEEQLESIIHQQVSVDEIVICDDCSEDATLDIVYKIARENPEVKWKIEHNERSLGVTKNFEKALSLCRGDIIFLSDQDDIWEPHKTRRIIDYMQKNPNVNLVFSDAQLVDVDGNLKTDKTLFDACGLRKLKEVWSSGLQFEVETVLQRLLGATFGMRQEFVRQCLPFSELVKNYHDGQLAMHSVVKACNGMLDECLIKYRIHGNNVVGLGGEKNWVYNQVVGPDELSILVEPHAVNEFFLLPYADRIRPRVDFYQKRISSYKTLSGKISLISNLYKYWRYYKQFWWRFFISDILYGIMNEVRYRLVRL